MKSFISKSFQILIVLIGVSFITFTLTYLAPGDPAEIMLTDSGNIPSPELLAKVRAELGLDKPFLIQYKVWLLKVLKGDLGMSFSLKVPVFTKLISSFLITLKLSVASFVLMLIISIPLGFISALNRNKIIDYIIRGFSFLGISVPNFWMGLIFLSIFGVKLGWVPIIGGTDNIKALILPAVTLALAMSSKYTRQIRIIVLEELKQEYIVASKIRGLSKRTIIFKQLLPNVMLPIMTLLGVTVGNLISGTAIIEIVYNWPGMGNLAIKAISAHDYPLIQGYVLFIALFYMIVNLAVDFSYKFLDPRVKE